MSPHTSDGVEMSKGSSSDDEFEKYICHGPRGSGFITFEVTYEDIKWMEPKRFLIKRGTSFTGLSQRIAAAFSRTLRPGAPLGDSMGSTYGANFELFALVADRDGGAAHLIIDSDVALGVALKALLPPIPLPEIYKIRSAVTNRKK